jgi:FKBP-type peptidyl-prolyl cis-trans isomerase SlpA
MNPQVRPDSLVTLHYRIALPGGQPLISTYDGNPATLQLGAGELLPQIERLLDGLESGSEHSFDLEPEQAFGARRDDLIERVRRTDLPEAELVEAMSIMEFSAPDGSRYSGLITQVEEDSIMIDFNHPLAGKHVRVDVRIVGVL